MKKNKKKKRKTAGRWSKVIPGLILKHKNKAKRQMQIQLGKTTKYSIVKKFDNVKWLPGNIWQRCAESAQKLQKVLVVTVNLLFLLLFPFGGTS